MKNFKAISTSEINEIRSQVQEQIQKPLTFTFPGYKGQVVIAGFDKIFFFQLRDLPDAVKIQQ